MVLPTYQDSTLTFYYSTPRFAILQLDINIITTIEPTCDTEKINPNVTVQQPFLVVKLERQLIIHKYEHIAK